MVVIGNGTAGLHALAAWRWRSLRGRPVWVTSAAAESAIVVQVVAGTILESDKVIAAPRMHLFYGFVALISVGLAYSYRQSLRGRLELFYGAVGLFLMGLGIRAMLLA